MQKEPPYYLQLPHRQLHRRYGLPCATRLPPDCQSVVPCLTSNSEQLQVAPFALLGPQRPKLLLALNKRPCRLHTCRVIRQHLLFCRCRVQVGCVRSGQASLASLPALWLFMASHARVLHYAAKRLACPALPRFTRLPTTQSPPPTCDERNMILGKLYCVQWRRTTCRWAVHGWGCRCRIEHEPCIVRSRSEAPKPLHACPAC